MMMYIMYLFFCKKFMQANKSFAVYEVRMKILITGAGGFVGRNVKEYLERQKKYKIYAPASKELDCTDEAAVTEYLRQHCFDCVLHFAVYGNEIDKEKDGSRILDYNLRIFLNFAKNNEYYGKMFYAGSGAEYDKRYDISRVTEGEIGKTIPVDQYGLMKYTVGQMIENSKNIFNLRLFGIFGKYEYYPVKFISNVCCKAIKGVPLTMRQNVYFDYLWVEDFCRMVEFFLNNEPQYHTYNMVSGQRISLLEICERVLEISGKKLPVFICREGLAREYTAQNHRFMQECQDFVYTPIGRAIEGLYHWYLTGEEEIDLYKLLY